jgi:hypothetical protein
VIAAASTEDKLAFAQSFGADLGVNYGGDSGIDPTRAKGGDFLECFLDAKIPPKMTAKMNEDP